MSDQHSCGIYRTTQPLTDQVPAGRLVYFHNHGNPGAGVYLPESWNLNRAQFSGKGIPVPSREWSEGLEALPAEGFYRVREQFHCCKDQCQLFEADLLVQLGYDSQAHPILFVPEWTEEGMAIPLKGTRIDADRVAKLSPLKIPLGTLPPLAERV